VCVRACNQYTKDIVTKILGVLIEAKIPGMPCGV
jgi:hypothetical protein